MDKEGDILEEIRSFYSNLYTSKGQIDLTYLDKLDIPKITDEMKEKLDAEITELEIAEALKSLENEKCPGTDGLDPSFYKMFYPTLKDFLMELFREISYDKLHLSARESVISLLEKLDKDPLWLQSWRPLSLLNTDNKIYGKILANRLQMAIQSLIHHSQQGFLADRMMTENVVKIQQVMQHCEDENIDALLISYDFWKAFDTLEWECIFKTLENPFSQNRDH